MLLSQVSRGVLVGAVIGGLLVFLLGQFRDTWKPQPHTSIHPRHKGPPIGCPEPKQSPTPLQQPPPPPQGPSPAVKRDPSLAQLLTQALPGDDQAQVQFIVNLARLKKGPAATVCHAGSSALLLPVLANLADSSFLHVAIFDEQTQLFNDSTVPSNVQLATSESLEADRLAHWPKSCDLVIAHFAESVTDVTDVVELVMKLRRVSLNSTLVLWTNFRSYLGASTKYYQQVHHAWKDLIKARDGLAPLNCTTAPSKSAICVAKYYTTPTQKRCYSWLSVQVMLPREMRYVVEFLLYHRYIAGFDCLYTRIWNGTEAQTAETNALLKPFVDQGWLGIGDRELKATDTYSRTQAHWSASWDLDEFWVATNDDLGNLNSRLRGFEPFEAIIFDRESMVPAGLVQNPPPPTFDSPDRLVIEHYDTAMVVNDGEWPSFCGKIICQTEQSIGVRDTIHRVWPKNESAPTVSDARQTIMDTDYYVPSDSFWGYVTALPERHVNSPMRLNHYIYRSYEDCKTRTSDFGSIGWRPKNAWQCEAIMGKGEKASLISMHIDTTILRHVPAMKKLMRAHYALLAESSKPTVESSNTQRK